MRTAERTMGKVLRRASRMLTENGGGGRDLDLDLYTDGRKETGRLYGDTYVRKRK